MVVFHFDILHMPRASTILPSWEDTWKIRRNYE
jgi:hypothetical protein